MCCGCLCSLVYGLLVSALRAALRCCIPFV